jgi:hypothetical protein
VASDEILYERRSWPGSGRRLRTRTQLTERKAIADVCPIGRDAEGRYTGAADPRVEAVAVGY